MADKAYDRTLGRMVAQHRKDTGRGETRSELQSMQNRLDGIVHGARPKIEAAKREREAKGKK